MVVVFTFDLVITAAIAEMLLQSHESGINLLPALPQVWSSGSVNGLRARGGYVIDLSWKDGKLTQVVISSKNAGKTEISWNGGKISLELKAGESRTLKPADFSLVSR